MFFVSFLLTVMFSFFQLQTIHLDLLAGNMIMSTPIIFLIVILAGTVVFAIKVGRSDKLIMDEPEAGQTDFDDDSHWIISSNRNDPSILGEKRFGVGWTINIGNPMGYLIILVPLAAIMVLSFW